jgi:hypothetical protein
LISYPLPRAVFAARSRDSLFSVASQAGRGEETNIRISFSAFSALAHISFTIPH